MSLDRDPDWYAGGCLCRQLRFRLTADPIIVHACHCRLCQKRSGSAFALNAIIETRCVEPTAGFSETWTAPSESPGGQLVHRCPFCRHSMWAHHPSLGRGLAIVRVGLLDKAERLMPDVHCFTRARHPWVRLPPLTPAFEFNYDPREVCTPANRLRFDAAVGAGNPTPDPA